MRELKNLLDKMWLDYCEMNPAAKEIHDLFVRRGEKIHNDHIALRTFTHPKLGIESLAKTFRMYGYREAGQYFFPEKKLFAKHYEHPDHLLPKVFISELELKKVSPFVRDVLNDCAEQIPTEVLEKEDFVISGRLWKMTKTVYQALSQESEYAAWVAAFGFRPNHFTINVNELKTLKDLEQVNFLIQTSGHTMNKSGGLIKGSPSVFLEQSSTMASEIPVNFSDGVLSIPGCYYEFAKRYPLPNGKLYQGFVATSADKIFESTNRKVA